MSKAAQSEKALEERRQKVRRRVAEIGEAVDQEVARAQTVRDAFVAVLGVAGLLVAAKGVSRALSGKRAGGRRKKKRRRREER